MRKSVATLVVLVLSLFLFSECSSQDISQWRGDNRDGQYIESNLLDHWPESGPDLLWSADGLGRGYAAPVVTDDKLFVNGEIDGISHLFAFDLEGKLLWKTAMGKEFLGDGFSATYPGARSTPTVVDDLVYTVSGLGQMICCDVANGRIKWKKNFINDLDGYIPYFGFAESLAIDTDNVYCYPSGAENNFVALDRLSGETKWTTPALKDTASYNSPIFIELPERTLLVTMSQYYLFGIDHKNGELLWSYDIKGYEAEGDHCNTPIYRDGYIYQVFGDRYSQGTVKLKLSDDGSSVSEVWHNDRVKNNFAGFIMHDNLLFLTIKGKYLKALELDHGQVVDSVKVATGALIFSDNKFICYGQNGEVSLVNYKQGKFEKGGSFRLPKGKGQHFSHPVLADGIMYIRHGNAVMAYKVK